MPESAMRDAETEWTNWSGALQAKPSSYAIPHDEDALQRIVREAESIRPVGAGHSFSPLVPTTGTVLSLDKLSGLVGHDTETHDARVWAGTRLFALGPMLHELGQGMPNLGDIDRQSVAGVLATATHGTGLELPCIAGGATALRLVTADGEALECSETENTDLFRAAAVSLGMLGVVTQVTLHNLPAYRLREQVRVQQLDDVLPAALDRARAHRNFEMFAFPFGRQAIVKTLDATDEAPTDADHGADSDDGALWFGCQLMRHAPPLGRTMQNLVGKVIRPSQRVNWSHRIFASQRNVRFNEMEYQLPAAAGPACLDEICHAIARSRMHVFFPVEFRFVAADDYWLSPFHGKPGTAFCSISIHQYHKQDYRPLFALVEPILQRHGGRPHWGKLHTFTAHQLRDAYPGLNRFLDQRARLDPAGKFLTPYLRELFGLKDA